VAPVNDAPVAGNDAFTTDQNVPRIIALAILLANDNDVDGDSLTVSEITQPANGSLVDNGDSTWIYTPNTGFHGVDSFAYTISEGQGGTATAAVSITVRQTSGTTTYSGSGGPIADNTTTTVNLVIADDAEFSIEVSDCRRSAAPDDPA